MICPACKQYVFIADPSECPNCGASVERCKPCFGTGQIDTWMSGWGDHYKRTRINCVECGGLGLKPKPKSDTVQT